MNNPIKLLLGFLLFYANKYPADKKTFYPLKDRVLKRFGKVIGWDIQHIEGVSCDACKDGMHFHYIRDMHAYGYEECWHCWGSGWYKPERWILLHQYQLGNHTFHIPGSVLKAPMDRPKEPMLCGRIIEGYVDHDAGPSLLSQECTLWLSLLVDIRNLKKTIDKSRRHLCTMPGLSRPFLFAINIPNQYQQITDMIHRTMEEPWEE